MSDSRLDPLFINNRISQHTHTLNPDLHHIPTHDWTHTFWSTGSNHVSGHQCHSLRNVSHDHIQAENKIFRIPVLPDFAVHSRLNFNAGPRINFRADERSNRAERVKSIGRLSSADLVL
jgi:hypothetical protein